MKKWSNRLLAGLLSLVLAACGVSEPALPEPQEQPPASEQVSSSQP